MKVIPYPASDGMDMCHQGQAKVSWRREGWGIEQYVTPEGRDLIGQIPDPNLKRSESLL